MKKIYATKIKPGQTIVWHGLPLKVETVTPVYKKDGKTLTHVQLKLKGSTVALTLSKLNRVGLI